MWSNVLSEIKVSKHAKNKQFEMKRLRLWLNKCQLQTRVDVFRFLDRVECFTAYRACNPNIARDGPFFVHNIIDFFLVVFASPGEMF